MASSYSRATQAAALLLGGASLGAVAAAILRRAGALDLQGKVVVVTGGSRGLGLLLAEEMGRQGAKVAICGRDEKAVERASRWLVGHGIEVIAEARDVGDPKDANAFVERIVRDFGGIDVLVNNAGIIQVAPLQQVDAKMIEEAMRANFWSAINMTFAALPHLKKRGADGRIVNIASIGGRIALPHMIGYTVSKFAMVGMSEALRTELSSSGIKVTTVIPGPMRTGSIYNAEFGGKHSEEFAWFSLLSSVPLLSVDAERAAKLIVRAAREGQIELRIGLSGHLLSILHGLAPRLFVRVTSAMNAFLPSPSQGPEGNETLKGRDVDSDLPGSPLTALTDRAARANNEEPPV